MKNGGYAIIDATGVDLNNLGTVSGLYKQILAAVKNGKPMALHGIVKNTQKFSPIIAYGGIETEGVFVSFFPETLHVTPSDVVSK